MSEFDFEPVRGLPAPLPADERILWQGAPAWRSLAIHAFHARKALIYFAIIGMVQALAQLTNGATLIGALKPLLWLVPMGLAATAILTALAYVSARTTVYTITNKRLVLRIGMALTMTINLPFKLIDAASLRLFADGSGDIPVILHEGNKLAYLVLWPHAKPFVVSKPQPAMRAVPNAAEVAKLLSKALAEAPAARAVRSNVVRLPPQAVAA